MDDKIEFAGGFVVEYFNNDFWFNFTEELFYGTCLDKSEAKKLVDFINYWLQKDGQQNR